MHLITDRQNAKEEREWAADLAVISARCRDLSISGVKQMQIKTVIMPVYRADDFDRSINSLISGGWKLKRRKIIGIEGEPTEAFNMPVVRTLYAELERGDIYPEEVTV